jgi:hypothetical protein
VKRKAKRSNPWKIVLYITITIIIAAALPLIIFHFFIEPKYDYMQEVPMDITVSANKSVGFNLDTDAIHFGKMPANSQGWHGFNLTNKMNESYRVHLMPLGEMAGWVSFVENDFIIEPDSIKEARAIASIPSGATPRKYTGTIRAYFKKVDNH